MFFSFSRIKSNAFLALCLLSSAPSFAADKPSLTGEGTLTAGQTTGNTSSTDLGAGLKLNDKIGAWGVGAVLSADYGKLAGITTKERYFGSLQGTRDLSPRAYLVVRLSDEMDKFSGYNSRIFSGAGAGYKLAVGPKIFWVLEAAPGYRVDSLVGAGSTSSFALHGSSKLKYMFNPAVSFTNDSDVNYAKISTQIVNAAGITAKLGAKLAARVSYEYRHESSPLPGKVADDTATRLSLVYGF
jgi:putative salt-induced outer membrane protein